MRKNYIIERREAIAPQASSWVSLPRNIMSIRVENLLNKGYKSMEKNNYAEAVVFIQKAVDLQPKNAELYAYLGEAYFFAGEYTKAEQAFAQRQKLILNDTYLSTEVQGYQGCILLEQGNIVEAEKLLREAIAQNAQSPQIYYSMAVLLMKQKKDKEAEEYLRKLDILDPFFYFKKIKELRNKLSKSLHEREDGLSLKI